MVESVAQSGALNRYIIDVYRKSSVAALDMVKANNEDPYVTTVGGETYRSETDEHNYAFYVSSSQLSEDQLWVKVDLVMVQNILGVPAGTIKTADGQTYENGRAQDVWAPLTGTPTVNRYGEIKATMKPVTVVAEDGSKEATYTFNLTILPSNTGVRSVTVQASSTSTTTGAGAVLVTGTVAQALDESGKVTNVYRTAADLKAKIAELETQITDLGVQIDTAASDAEKNELETKKAAVEAEKTGYQTTYDRYYTYTDGAGNKQEIAQRQVYYASIPTSAVWNKAGATVHPNSTSRVNVVAMEESSYVGMTTLRGGTRVITSNVISKNSADYKNAALIDEMTDSKGVVDWTGKLGGTRDYPEYPAEQPVESVYFQVEAQDGSVSYYVLELRNADTENLNLNYVEGEKDGEAYEGYGLWVYATGHGSKQYETLKPNAQVLYTAKAGAVGATAVDINGVTRYATTDPKQAVLDDSGKPIPVDYVTKGDMGETGEDKDQAFQKPVYDENGQPTGDWEYIPLQFQASVGTNVTTLQVSAQAEYKNSYVYVNNTDSYGGEGWATNVFDRSIAIADTLYVYVISESAGMEQQRSGLKENEDYRRYVVHINRVSDIRTLDKAELLAGGANQYWTTVGTPTNVINVPVAATTTKADLRLTSTASTAIVTLHAYDETTGDFSDKPMEFYVSAENGEYKLVDGEYVKVAESETGNYNRITSGIHVLTATGLDMPLDVDTVPFQVRISNVDGDLSPRKYQVNLQRKHNNLDAESIYYNNRKAALVSGAQVEFALNDDGSLSVGGKLVEDLKAAIEPESGNKVDTTLLTGSDLIKALLESGSISFQKKVNDGWSDDKAVTGSVRVYSIQIPADSNTGKLNVISADPAMYVDVDKNFSMTKGHDSMYETGSYVNTAGMKVGDTIPMIPT